jgi:hypothetical protein
MGPKTRTSPRPGKSGKSGSGKRRRRRAVLSPGDSSQPRSLGRPGSAGPCPIAARLRRRPFRLGPARLGPARVMMGTALEVIDATGRNRRRPRFRRAATAGVRIMLGESRRSENRTEDNQDKKRLHGNFLQVRVLQVRVLRVRVLEPVLSKSVLSERAP